VDAHILPNTSKKFKQTSSARKLMATVFWGRKGALMVEFMQQGTIITPRVHCKTKGGGDCIRPLGKKGVECWHPV
jgi:hypothetical protein